MKYTVSLIAVKDIAVSRKFYEEVLLQKVVLDFGRNVTFEGGFSIQADFIELMGNDEIKLQTQSNDHELYFEVDDFDDSINRLRQIEGIKYLHDVKEYPWGQRVIRFYDPDMHIIEVGEGMDMVIKRFLDQGFTAEETAARTLYPIEYVKAFQKLR